MSPETTGTAPGNADSARERAIADAISRFVDLQARGETVDVASFCRQNAGLLPELQDQLDVVLQMDAILDSGHGSLASAPASEPLPERLSGLRILDAPGIRGRTERGPRIGVDYAEEWAERPLRFWVRDSRGVSRARRSRAVR